MKWFKCSKIILMFILILTMTSCAAWQRSNTESRIYKILSVAANTYQVTMQSCAGLYNRGYITVQEKDNIVKHGFEFWNIYQNAVTLLEEYSKTNDAQYETALEKQLSEMQIALDIIIKYVAEYSQRSGPIEKTKTNPFLDAIQERNGGII